jgi:hypothetical protein
MSHGTPPKHVTQQLKPDSANGNAYARSVAELDETEEDSEDEVTHATLSRRMVATGVHIAPPTRSHSAESCGNPTHNFTNTPQ